MRTQLSSALLGCLASVALTGCTLDIADTQCLTDIDCPIGYVCGQNANTDLICLVDGAGADTGTTDTGADTVDPADTSTDTATGTENCANGIDDDGDGAIDCDDRDCFTRPACTCGNGTIDDNEDCDGALLAGESCATLGFPGGRLSCQDTCQYDLRGCDAPENLFYAWDRWAPGERVEGNFEIIAGDMAFSCYETPSDDIDYVVTALAFGMAGDFSTRRNVDLLIWNQTEDLTPSDLLFQGNYDVPSNDVELQTITIAEALVRVSGVFCLGVIHNGFVGPTMANDFDGIAAPEAQGLVRTVGGIEQVFAIEDVAFGDWILRAAIIPAVR